MWTVLRQSSCTLALLLVSSAGQLWAQRAAESRRGLWISLSVQAVSAGCNDCSGRDTGIGGSVELGATLGASFRLGLHAELSFMDDDSEADVGLLGIAGQLYPRSASGTFVRGVVGLAGQGLPDLGDAADYPGPAALISLGHDVKLSSTLALSPHAGGMAAVFGGTTVTTFHVGVGLTRH